MRLRILAAGLLAVASAQAQAQREPKNFDQAVGWMYQKVEAAEQLATGCAERFPHLADEIEKDRARWLAADARVIAIAYARFDELLGNDVESLRKADAMIAEGVRQQFLAIDSTPRAGSFCSEWFETRANGDLRARHPKLYALLENERPGD